MALNLIRFGSSMPGRRGPRPPTCAMRGAWRALGAVRSAASAETGAGGASPSFSAAYLSQLLRAHLATRCGLASSSRPRSVRTRAGRDEPLPWERRGETHAAEQPLPDWSSAPTRPARLPWEEGGGSDERPVDASPDRARVRAGGGADVSPEEPSGEEEDDGRSQRRLGRRGRQLRAPIVDRTAELFEEAFSHWSSPQQASAGRSKSTLQWQRVPHRAARTGEQDRRTGRDAAVGEGADAGPPAAARPRSPFRRSSQSTSEAATSSHSASPSAAPELSRDTSAMPSTSLPAVNRDERTPSPLAFHLPGRAFDRDSESAQPTAGRWRAGAGRAGAGRGLHRWPRLRGPSVRDWAESAPVDPATRDYFKTSGEVGTVNDHDARGWERTVRADPGSMVLGHWAAGELAHRGMRKREGGSVEDCRRVALRSLELHGLTSRKRMAWRLRAFADETVQATLDALTAEGVLSDAAFAEMELLRQGGLSLRSPELVRRVLTQEHGVSAGDMEEALTKVYGTSDLRAFMSELAEALGEMTWAAVDNASAVVGVDAWASTGGIGGGSGSGDLSHEAPLCVRELAGRIARVLGRNVLAKKEGMWTGQVVLKWMGGKQYPPAVCQAAMGLFDKRGGGEGGQGAGWAS